MISLEYRPCDSRLHSTKQQTDKEDLSLFVGRVSPFSRGALVLVPIYCTAAAAQWRRRWVAGSERSGLACPEHIAALNDVITRLIFFVA
jgi:hypothetical protein